MMTQYKINGKIVDIETLAKAWLEKQSRKEMQAAQQRRSKRYGIAVQEGGALTIPARFEQMGATEGDFADPVNYRYPVWLTRSPDNITPEQLGQVRNAQARFAQFSDAYDDASRGKVRARIDQARRKFKVGPYTERGAEKSWEFEVVGKAMEKQIVYGIPLTPGLIDSQGDSVSPEDIEDAAHNFMLQSQAHDLNHESVLDSSEVRTVESYIAPADFTMGGKTVTKGSWVLAVKVFNDEIWQAIKRGDLAGFSIVGRGVREEME